MGNNRSKVPDLEKLVKGGRKKFVRYEGIEKQRSNGMSPPGKQCESRVDEIILNELVYV